jgi:hypothetical protein
MIDLSQNTYAYKTIHALHKDYNKAMDQCSECQELRELHQKYTDTQIDQYIEDKYHHHGDRE